MTVYQMVCSYGKKNPMYSLNLQAKGGYCEGTGLGGGVQTTVTVGIVGKGRNELLRFSNDNTAIF